MRFSSWSGARLGCGLSVLVLLLGNGCGTGTSHRPAAAPIVGNVFHVDKLKAIDQAVEAAIAEGKCPGAVVWIERREVAYHRAYGRRAVLPAPEPMTEDTIFDAASLTKVIATTPAVMLLAERGKIDLESPVSQYLPEFAGEGREKVTVRQLLTHTSGLRPDISLSPEWSGNSEAIRLSCEERLRAEPDEKFIYSDTNFMLLAEIVRRVAGEPFDVFVQREVYRPLKMFDTGFNPSKDKQARAAPTTVVDGEPYRGVVHDPRARRMEGVAGHAGLFTTAEDLAKFCRMMLGRGQTEGRRVFTPETVDLMTRVQTPPDVLWRRGLGWDVDSRYASQRGSVFPLGGYGHTGWTGTSVWIDPFSRTFVILLSNRNHPDEKGSVVALRRAVGTLAAEAVIEFNFQHVPGALEPRQPEASGLRRAYETKLALNGIDVLVKQEFAPLAGLKVGLITNHTGQDRRRRATIDLLSEADGPDLVALFSPEHGLRGVLDSQVADSVDSKTGLPVHSLYGETRQPSPEQLANLDALVFDIQDIGCRFYTYISTLGLAMEAAAQAGLKFFVLDRVNPIGGTVVEGPLAAGDSSFTAFHPIPIRHGMTVGELARMFNAERGWDCDLTVVPVENWPRERWFDETGLPWTNPSPNMRSLTEATLYPGIGLLETTKLSVGRGTDTPFELLGAPYIDDVRLAWELNRAGLDGVRFVPERFTPNASKFKDKRCAGVRLIITDREALRPVAIGITIAMALHRLHPDAFDLESFNRLLVHPATVKQIRSGASFGSIQRSWAEDTFKFAQRRKTFLLYP